MKQAFNLIPSAIVRHLINEREKIDIVANNNDVDCMVENEDEDAI